MKFAAFGHTISLPIRHSAFFEKPSDDQLVALNNQQNYSGLKTVYWRAANNLLLDEFKVEARASKGAFSALICFWSTAPRETRLKLEKAAFAAVNAGVAS